MDRGGKQCANEMSTQRQCCYFRLVVEQSRAAHSRTAARIAARERYGSAKQEGKFHAELRARRREANEDLPALRADIPLLMSLAFPGDVSSIGQKMAIDYFLDALDDPDFEIKIRESEPKHMNEPYTRALRLEMIRKKLQKKRVS